MFGLFEKKNEKDKNKDIQKMGTAIRNDKIVRQQTAEADAYYKKPDYNPRTRKSHYDDSSAHRKAKDAAFSDGKPVKDPYSGNELLQTVKEAKQKYGDKWQEHLAETDHIDPLSQIANRSQKSGWLTADDIKDVANDPDNLQMLSRSNNQTGGKGGNTQEDWSKDPEKMKKLSEQSGKSPKDIAKKIRKAGKKAQKRNDKKLAKRKVKNIATTGHSAGKVGAINSAKATGAMSTINNVVSVVKGEKDVSEAIKDTGEDTMKSTVNGYVNGASLTVINHTLTSSKSKFLTTLGEKNVAGKAVTAVSLTGSTIKKWGAGEISTKECFIELGETGCNMGGSVVGGSIGGAITTVIGIPPVIGEFVGSYIGGILTSQVYNGLVNEIQQQLQEKDRRIQEEANKKIMEFIAEYQECQRRERVKQEIQYESVVAIKNSIKTIIESQEFQCLINEIGRYLENHQEVELLVAQCTVAALQMQEYRRQLEEYIDTYFSECRHAFDEALDLMDTSLALGDYDGAIDETNQITRLFGKEPVIENTEDFKKKVFGNEKIVL